MNSGQAPTVQGSSTVRQAGDRRERLLKTAIRLFSERPYAQVSVQDIADEADVAAGLLYYYFTDKEGLYAAGLELLAEELRARMQAAMDTSSEPLERLLASLKAHLEFAEQYPNGYRELLTGGGSQLKVKGIIERERRETLRLIVEGLPEEVPRTPVVMSTLEGWLRFVEGVQLAWMDERQASGYGPMSTDGSTGAGPPGDRVGDPRAGQSSQTNQSGQTGQGHQMSRDEVSELCTRVLVSSIRAAMRMAQDRAAGAAE